MTASRYSTVAVVLHWLIALLVIGQIAGGLYMEKIPDAEAARKFEFYQLHKSFGFTILVLTIGRLAWRLTHRPPPLPAGMAAWERAAARSTHALFYALLLGVPLLGWAYVSVAPLNIPTVLFGIVELPHLPFFAGVEDRKDTAEFFEEFHEIAAKGIIALLILHVAAALKHHFINGDDVLARMLPLVRARKAS